MPSKDQRHPPLSTDVSPAETETDLQLSACAQEGHPPYQLLNTPTPKARRRATHRSQTERSPAPMRLAIDQLLSGRYRIERELGEGGMGVVYLVADEQVPGERFAVKVLKDELHSEALSQMREEVRKTRKLSHQNIVDVHSVNVDGQRLYVLMEYLEGKSLNVLLDEEFGRGMPFSHAWPIIKDIAAALSNAHDHSVIHSDVKPANVLLTTSGRTKLLDFGIARAARGPLLHAHVGPRALTPAYASVEMLQGKEADRRDDVYSFACLIYETLCGERPFGELTALEARESAKRMRPLQLLTREQNAALARALAFDREARTGSVETLLEGLAAHAPSRVRPFLLLGAAVLGAAAIVSLGYVAISRGWLSRNVVIDDRTLEARPPPSHVATPTSPDVTERSIAVLPFVNMSGDSSQEYFSDGLSEELIDHLVHSTDLKVIARTSSFQFKGKNVDARSIARDLAVTHLLEGSVRKDGRQLRVTAQLVRASDGTYLWSHTYDYALADIFKVQDEIAENVSQALEVALPSGYRTGVPPDVRAYNLVLEGNYFKARRTLPDVERAAELYQQAIDISPEYALAWARLASAFLSEEILKGRPSQDQNKRLLHALDQAIRLEPNLVWAYYTKGGFEMNVTWNWAEARAEGERIRAIDPRFVLLQRALGDIALTFGEVEKAVGLYRNDLERNPLDPDTLDRLGSALCAASRIEQCLEARLRLLQLHPEFGGVNRSVGIAHLYFNQLPEALASMQRESNEDYRLTGLAMVYSAMGKRAESDAALNSLVEKFASSDAYRIAEVHAYRGEISEAFRWLDRAYQDHNFGMVGLKTEPLLRNLHSDPRFEALLSRMRLSNRT
jgi:TolB-like protein